MQLIDIIDLKNNWFHIWKKFSQKMNYTLQFISRQSLPQGDFVWHEESGKYPPGQQHILFYGWFKTSLDQSAETRAPKILTRVPKTGALKQPSCLLSIQFNSISIQKCFISPILKLKTFIMNNERVVLV